MVAIFVSHNLCYFKLLNAKGTVTCWNTYLIHSQLKMC